MNVKHLEIATKSPEITRLEKMVWAGINNIWQDTDGIEVSIETDTPAVSAGLLNRSMGTGPEREMVVVNGFVRLYHEERDISMIVVEILDFVVGGRGALALREKASFDDMANAVAYAVSHMVRAQLEEELPSVDSDEEDLDAEE